MPDPVLRVDPAVLQVRSLGECRYASPLTRYVQGRRTNEHYVAEHDRVLLDDTRAMLDSRGGCDSDQLPTFEPGGPRARVFFEPGTVRAGIVTCGGLCPGLNDVIAALVRELTTHYGATEILGFRHGFAGLVPGALPPVVLTREVVDGIDEQGGTVLGTSRGNQDPALMVDRLVELGLDALFVVGGDGSMQGAATISAELRRRGLPIAVVVVPKTIDNDIPWIGQSFGFQTAFTVAARSVRAARVEAQASPNGVGLVKLMGRHSGFIACYAALASHAADIVLIPEVQWDLDGDDGVLAAIAARVRRHGSAVVVVAEGAGQEWLATDGGTDASGNARLADVGLFLKAAITAHFAAAGVPLNLKYLDPSYAIRSVPAEPPDAVYCIRLAQAAVHAAMAGRTDLMVGRRHNRFIHVPFAAVTQRNLVATDGDLWLAVLESTEQPFLLAELEPELSTSP